MPRRRKNANNPPRVALRAIELESKMMGMLRGRKACAELKGVRFIFVGSHGQEPNWFAYPIPISVSGACKSAFVSALATVRKQFDLLKTASETPPMLAPEPLPAALQRQCSGLGGGGKFVRGRRNRSIL
jgi:hypothetical protein